MTAAEFPDPVYDVTCSCGATFEAEAQLPLDGQPVAMGYAWSWHVFDAVRPSQHRPSSLAFADAARLREMRAARRPAATDSDEQPAVSVPGWAERHSGSQGGER